jgi:hypothetical protein
MGKILQSDVLNADVGGVTYVTISFSDEVGEVFFVCFPLVLFFDFRLGWHWGLQLSSSLGNAKNYR